MSLKMMTKNIKLLSILFFSVTFSSNIFAFDCSEELQYGIPDSSNKVELLCKSAFVNGFDRSISEPRWSLMVVTKQSINRTCNKQPDFEADPSLPTYVQADNRAYYNNQWDKGHLSDRATVDSSCLAETEATYYTNAVPQHERMNRVGWRTLESRLRKVINTLNDDEKVFILTGTIIRSYQRILNTNVVIPDKLYKAIYIPSRASSVAFVYDNAPLKTKQLKNGVISLLELENEYGINSFKVPNNDIVGDIFKTIYR